VKDTGRRKRHNLSVKPGNAQFNAELPKELKDRIAAMSKRKGLTVAAYAERVFRAALDSEDAMAPGFLEAWEKFLQRQAAKKA